jgi:hypothetical protein
MCFMVLYSIVYLPLHYGGPVNFGESPQLGDLLALCGGALAVVLGVLAWQRPPANPRGTGAWLILAGALVLALTVLWAFPETFGLGYYFSRPFYFGFVYFCPLGNAHIGSAYESGFLQLPLLVSSAAVLVAGCLMALGRGRPANVSAWR